MNLMGDDIARLNQDIPSSRQHHSNYTTDIQTP